MFYKIILKELNRDITFHCVKNFFKVVFPIFGIFQKIPISFDTYIKLLSTQNKIAALIISKVGINIIRYEASWINQSVQLIFPIKGSFTVK